MLGEGSGSVYRYNQAARRQAVLYVVLAGIMFVLLLGVLGVQWGSLGFWTRVIGVILVVIVLFTVRSQLTRLLYRLRIQGDTVEIDAPTSRRRIPLATITEVRRLQLPQFGRDSRWACTLVVPGRRGMRTPMLLFDNQLEHAEEALNQLVAQTPHATHTGLRRA